MKTFLDSITTNLTRFFRNQAHFDALVNHVIPDLVAFKRAKNLEKRIRFGVRAARRVRNLTRSL